METGLWKQFDRIVVFDTETTGIEFGRDEIIELGAAAFSAEGETDCMDLLLRLSPGRTLPPFITQLTGITEEQLEQEGVEKADACEAFCNLLGGGERTLLAAYNAQFDLNFLYHFLRPFGRADVLRAPRFLDVLTVYRDRRDYPHKLNDAITAYGLEDQAVNSHRAVDDARAAGGHGGGAGRFGPVCGSIRLLPQVRCLRAADRFGGVPASALSAGPTSV